MIIFITGATHTGKTVLAQRLLERHRIPYLSIDHLKMGLIRSGNTTLTVNDEDKLTGYLWPIVREMVKTAIENGQNLIVEGCYIPANWRQDFEKQYLPHIRLICLALSDGYIDENFSVITAHANDVEKRLDDTYVTPELLKRENHRMVEDFGKDVILIESDYQETLYTIQ